MTRFGSYVRDTNLAHILRGNSSVGDVIRGILEVAGLRRGPHSVKWRDADRPTRIRSVIFWTATVAVMLAITWLAHSI